MKGKLKRGILFLSAAVCLAWMLGSSCTSPTLRRPSVDLDAPVTLIAKNVPVDFISRLNQELIKIRILNSQVTFVAENLPIDVIFRLTQELTKIKILIAPDLEQAWRNGGDDGQFRIFRRV